MSSAFPEPLAPIAPILSSHTFGRNQGYDYPSLMSLENKLHVTSGRAAIALALMHAGITEKDEVLAPAFHCESMIAPIRHLGAKPIFYSICEKATLELDKCKALLTEKTRAIIVTHYFGFPQEMETITAFCQAHNLVLIEDCAHCIFGSYQGKTLGSFGDYAIASTMKFFPVYDGGILASSKHSLAELKLSPCSISFELKSALTIIERSIRMGRFSWAGKFILQLANLKDSAWGLFKKSLLKGKKPSTPPSAEGGFTFDANWLNIEATKSSQTVIRKTNLKRVVEQRRLNYQRYLEELGDLPGIEFLHPCLPDTIVPLIVPITFEKVDDIFYRLKSAGLPIWRFGEFLDPEITADICPQSIRYSTSLLQFPCHQELKAEELDWIIEQIKVAINSL